MTAGASYDIIMIVKHYVLRGAAMAANTVVSSKYQVVIPKEAREHARLRPGQKLAVIVRGKTITLVPIPELEDLIGFAPEISLEG